VACRVATLSRSDCIVVGLMLTRNWRPQSSLNITTPGSLCCRQFTYMQQTHQTNVSSIAQIPLGSSRHVSTRHVPRVERVETSVSSHAVRQSQHSQNAWARHIERVVSRCDVTSQVEFGLINLDSQFTGVCRWRLLSTWWTAACVHIRRLKPSTP